MELWSDLAEWRGPSPNTGDGDARLDEPEDRAVEQRGVVLHIAEGYYEGTISWQRNAAADVSSQFVVAGPRDKAKTGTADGKIAQCVPVDIRAWTQRDGNGHWISIECSGLAGDALSPAQIESCARILARAHKRYGVPLQLATSPSGRGLGHHSMGAESGANWGHSQCPGERIKAQKPLILARAIEIAGGAGPTAGDDDMLTSEEKIKLHVMGWMVQNGVVGLQDPVEIPPNGAIGYAGWKGPNKLAQALAAAGGVLTAEQAAAIGTTIGAAVHIPTAAEIATAVLDEDHRRSET